ncbi:MAG: glutamate-1-semialdehyde 2,1-aminomutase [Gemmatimonadota bacterium]|nr:glutamate-1-semialdehyde 2,1-aminomutase [Gemmatimonadota bacterium]
MTTSAHTPVTDESRRLYTESRKVFPGGVSSPVRAFNGVGGTPRFMVSGKGAYVTDADGNALVDYVLAYGPHILGHAPPSVIEAITSSALHGTSFGAPSLHETRLAHLIQKFVPSMAMMRFVTSGTEAVMSAIRLARAATRRTVVIKFEGNYHGHSDSVLARAGSGVATLGLPDSPGVPSGATRDTMVLPYNDIAAVRAAFKAHGANIAAVIVEPVAGNMGLVLPVDGFLESLRGETTEHGALLIFDEVMTGFRVHPNGAQGLYGITPDLTMLGKVVGGGLPVGAYGGREDLMRQIAPDGPVYQAGTLAGNPVVMAAGIAVMEEIAKPGVWDAAAQAAAALATGLREAARLAGLDLQVPQLGTMLTPFFSATPVTDYASARKSDTKRYARFFHALLDGGVSPPPSAFETWFTSTAHGQNEVERTIIAARAAMT